MPLGADLVTILRVAAKDWQGDPSGAAAQTDVPGCSFQPGGTQERTARGDTVIASDALYLPAGTDILATDRVSYMGQVYAVDGEPARWSDDTGTEQYVRVALKMVAGA
jgi:hypothetical protein